MLLPVTKRQLVTGCRIAPCAIGIEFHFAASTATPPRQPGNLTPVAPIRDSKGLVLETCPFLAAFAVDALPRHCYFSRHLSDRWSSAHLETDAFLLLKIRNDLKKIAGGRISPGSKHLMKGFHVHLRMFRQLRKANRRIDVIAQQLFSKRDFADEKGFNGIAKKTLTKRGIASYT